MSDFNQSRDRLNVREFRWTNQVTRIPQKIPQRLCFFWDFFWDGDDDDGGDDKECAQRVRLRPSLTSSKNRFVSVVKKKNDLIVAFHA